MSNHPVFMWDCCRCGDRMKASPDIEQVTRDRDAHIGNCPRYRGPRHSLELRISNTGTFAPAYVL